jgi:hypothetical protein
VIRGVRTKRQESRKRDGQKSRKDEGETEDRVARQKREK